MPVPTRCFRVRLATEDDSDTIRRIAELDSSRPIEGPALIGDLGRAPVAVLSLADGRVTADPFRPTAALIAHMRAEAARTRAVRRRSPADRIRALLRRHTPARRTASTHTSSERAAGSVSSAASAPGSAAASRSRATPAAAASSSIPRSSGRSLRSTSPSV